MISENGEWQHCLLCSVKNVCEMISVYWGWMWMRIIQQLRCMLEHDVAKIDQFISQFSHRVLVGRKEDSQAKFWSVWDNLQVCFCPKKLLSLKCSLTDEPLPCCCLWTSYWGTENWVLWFTDSEWLIGCVVNALLSLWLWEVWTGGGHFGPKTLRHWDTSDLWSGHFGPLVWTLRT